ncbi:M48 family metalloprotease [Streptomyces sp. NBC_01497]|uniref:M48 family metalloprotease n=1 Tax=Streptomyces sp. NBC_01497 TaxID=2903885 RepID=UPI002E3372C3|nr:M48 family metalloprotease [Streptomyces sp. NBC_01497]
MIMLLVLPVLLPFAAPLFARRLVGRLEPNAALWLLTAATVALGGSTVAALAGLVLTGALRLPVVARLGRMIHPMATGPVYVLVPVAALAVAALLLCAGTAVRTVRRERRSLGAAHAEADRARTAEGLSVVADERVDAYALPGRAGGPGRVVVTEGMLGCLGTRERAALVAHERAHLAGRHHLFLAAAELSAHCHPGLRSVRQDVALAVERAADEAAARATGDRRLTALAIGRAALAAHAAPARRPSVLPSATAGPVPQRVAALLKGPVSGARRPVAAAFALLLLCAGISSSSTLAGAVDLHSGVEVAQGESGPHHQLPR